MPATYIVQHRDSGTEYLVRVLKMVKVKATTYEEGGYPSADHDNFGELMPNGTDVGGGGSNYGFM